jgi:hypothetical protein
MLFLLGCSEGLRLDGINTTDLPSDLQTVRLYVAYKERIIYAGLLAVERKTFLLHSADDAARCVVLSAPINNTLCVMSRCD